jgi:acetyl esterase/lipase
VASRLTRAIAVTSVRLRARTPPPVRAPDEVLHYRSTAEAELTMDVYRPEGWSSSDTRTAIVFFFGGGWANGSTSQFHHQAAHFAELGVVAYCAQYRVSDQHQTTPFDAVDDAHAALRWLWRGAATHGIHPDRIVAGGASSGAHLAACTALLTDTDVAPGEPPHVPAALVLFNPVIDTSKAGSGHHRLKERYRELSPIEHVHASTPPTLIMVGAKDKITPASGSTIFANRMQAKARRCDLEIYPRARHGFFNPGVSAEFYDLTLERSTRFLRDLGLV